MLNIEQIQSYYPKEIRSFKRNILREYLQYKILEAIYESSIGTKLSFMGGTCIHILYSNPRFSEDLDFDNLNIKIEDFEVLSKYIKRKLELEGYTVELKIKSKDAFRAFFRFPNILHESGLSGYKEEKLLVQIDTEPQNFYYNPEKVIINKFDVFSRINTVPIDILLSQKIFCIFSRKRIMGRDFYDIIFLMAKTKPNYRYLNDKVSIKNNKELKEGLLSKCKELDFDKLTKDIEPFLYNKNEINKIKLFSEYILQYM